MTRRPPRSTLFPYNDALPIYQVEEAPPLIDVGRLVADLQRRASVNREQRLRSEEHTSELQSQSNLVCRLLLEKKKNPSSARDCSLRSIASSPRVRRVPRSLRP